ncbi:MAG: hypothetical protein BWX66_00970 [Deltaproteobacteria bacterium ADurb.Bin058]|nr:MAG: hypothetical protein BWX66_00970 [Deltaproteobacteria bacterium ADurb.Bin058]
MPISHCVYVTKGTTGTENSASPIHVRGSTAVKMPLALPLMTTKPYVSVIRGTNGKATSVFPVPTFVLKSTVVSTGAVHLVPKVRSAYATMDTHCKMMCARRPRRTTHVNRSIALETAYAQSGTMIPPSASAALVTILTVTSACCMGVRYSQIRCALASPVVVMVLVWSPLTTRLCAFVMRATVARG